MTGAFACSLHSRVLSCSPHRWTCQTGQRSKTPSFHSQSKAAETPARPHLQLHPHSNSHRRPFHQPLFHRHPFHRPLFHRPPIHRRGILSLPVLWECLSRCSTNQGTPACCSPALGRRSRPSPGLSAYDSLCFELAEMPGIFTG